MDYDYDQLFPARFLKAELLKSKKSGKPISVTLTITNVELETFPGKKPKDPPVTKVVVSFKEKTKQLILNKTNAECIKGMFGTNTRDWKGKRVTFYPRLVEAFGAETMAVRVYGSPDLKSDMQFVLNLGQKHPVALMKKTEAGKATALPPTPPPEPEMVEEPLDEPEHDSLTGEVAFEGAEAAG